MNKGTEISLQSFDFFDGKSCLCEDYFQREFGITKTFSHRPFSLSKLWLRQPFVLLACIHKGQIRKSCICSLWEYRFLKKHLF